MRFLVLLAVMGAASVCSAGPVDEWLRPVQNGGFEKIAADGKGLEDWGFSISREAKITMTVDRAGGREGGAAIMFHNESPLSPHVYGRLRQVVKVLPGLGYRLSCWARGEKVGADTHWTDWKSYRLDVPSGTFGWTRVETYFVTAADQKELDLGLNVVDRAEKLWIDDVELVADLAEGQGPGEARLAYWSAPQAAPDKEPLPVRVFYEGLPAEMRLLRVEVLTGKERAGLLEQALPEAAGEFTGEVKLVAAMEREGTVSVTISGGAGAVIQAKSRAVDLVSAAYLRKRLEATRAQLPRLQEAMRDWERQKLPTDYPRVTATLAESFLPWIEEDITRGELVRALQEVEELDEVLAGALKQCAKPPPVEALRVPRYLGGPIKISGGHFEAGVAYPGQARQVRPVFFMGYGHFMSVKRDIEKLPAYGLNIIQVEFGPNSVVGPDFVIKTGAIDEFLALLQRCEKAGVAVNLLLSPHYFPQWAYEKWPHLGNVNGGFIRFDVDAPEARQVEEAFLKAVIPRLKGQPALHSLCLSNEPVYISAPDSEHNRSKWHAWLSERHGDIAKLNGLYGTEHKGFEEVPVPPAEDLTPCARLYDWVTFNNERFAGWHRWMADVIHEIAPEIPVHAKTMNMPFSRGTLNYGNDIEQFCDLSQIAGNDAVNVYMHDERSQWGDTWQGEYMYYDLLRSMRGQPVFNSENHIVYDRDWQPVPGMHMRNLIWQGALHGLGASTTWVWERTYEPKSDFAGSIMHRPAMCDAHGRAALDLMRLGPEMVALQDAPARVAVVYSICSQVWNQQYASAVSHAYLALTQLGEKVDFITWKQLAGGGAGKYSAIIAPEMTYFEEEGYRALEEWSLAPGHQVILVGEKGLAADEYNRPRSTEKLSAVEMADGEGLRARLREELPGEWPVQVLDAATGKTMDTVGFRWAKDGGRWLVNVCNYGRKPVKVTVKCPGRRVRNLLTGEMVSGAIELQGMEPVLLESK